MEQSAWDWIITGGVLLSLILVVWARVSGMTIPELLREIREFFQESGEETMPEAMVWRE